jgi:proteasome alpha subunit
MFSAMGQQADVENLRLTAVDFAHQEGFARSEADVTIGRVVGFALSNPMKRAFGDVTSAPFVVLALFAEMNTKPEEDLFFKLHYDGDFEMVKNFSAAAGTRQAEERMQAMLLERYNPSLSIEEAQALADDVWRVGADTDGNGQPDPALTDHARAESGFLDRSSAHQRKFRLLK